MFTAFMIGVEIMVVLHWFLFPDNPVLFTAAMAAGVVMCLMAVADFILMLAVFRKDPSQPQHLQELLDLGKIEGIWAFATVVQVAFFAAALMAHVYWMAMALVLGQGSELAAFLVARGKTRKMLQTGPGGG